MGELLPQAGGPLVCNHWTVLQEASSSGDLDRLGDAIKGLLAPALVAAVKNDQAPAVAFLLDRGADLKQGVFLRAAESKSYRILELFLEHGFDINTPMGFFQPPPLGYICDDHELAEWFLDHGASPNTLCHRDYTPLSAAVWKAPFSCIRLLVSRGGLADRGQLLHQAATRELPDRCEVMEYLLERGGECAASLNKIMYQDYRWQYLFHMNFGIGTPLHLAARRGSLDLVQLLVAKGADPLIKDPHSEIALDCAQSGGHEDVVDFLRPLSADRLAPRHDFVDQPGLHIDMKYHQECLERLERDKREPPGFTD